MNKKNTIKRDIKKTESKTPNKTTRVKKQTKKKSKFPDHSGDGKITKKDILMAKGIIPKKKKKGKK